MESRAAAGGLLRFCSSSYVEAANRVTRSHKNRLKMARVKEIMHGLGQLSVPWRYQSIQDTDWQVIVQLT